MIYRLLEGPDFIGVLGPIHGILFLVYFFLVLRIRDSQGWGFWRTVGVLVASAIPLGGFWAAGTWRRTTGAWAGEVDVAV